MLFYYIRHGDPIYDPDSLTPLGKRQAEAVGRRLARFDFDTVYTSSSTRAMETAKPLCELIKKEPVVLDWANESHAGRETGATREDGRWCWIFAEPRARKLFVSEEMRAMGFDWMNHPALADKKQTLENGFARVERETTALFSSLGYDRLPDGSFRCTSPNDKRVALFAHGGFGMMFLSTLLHIPYPAFSTRFDLVHTGLCVIRFADEDGIAYPCMLMHGSTGHLYAEHLADLALLG